MRRPGNPACFKAAIRLGATHSGFAVHDGLARRVDFIHASYYLAQRDQPRSRDARNLVFKRLANVDYLQVLATIESLLEFSRRDFFQ